jgi:hypothetical protein
MQVKKCARCVLLLVAFIWVLKNTQIRAQTQAAFEMSTSEGRMAQYTNEMLRLEDLMAKERSRLERIERGLPELALPSVPDLQSQGLRIKLKYNIA